MKIAFVLLRTIGDVIIGNVLVKNIRLKYPDAEIHWFVDGKFIDLAVHNPNVNKVITCEDYDELLKSVSSDYDEVIFAAQTTSTDNNWHQKKQHRYQHLLDFYAQKCNLEIKDRRLELFIEDDGHEIEFNFKKPVVAIHTTTLADVKDWSRFTELVKELNDLGYSVVQLGSNNDVAVAGTHKIEVPLKEVMVMFKRRLFDVFVGLDSGLTYMSVAFGTPTVELLGATISTTSGPWGKNLKILLADNNDQCKKDRSGVRCHGIERGVCRYKSKCIDNITVKQVIDAINEVLNRRNDNG